MTTLEMAKAARGSRRVYASGTTRAWWDGDTLIAEIGGNRCQLTLAMVLSDSSTCWHELVPPKSWSGEYRVRGKRDGCEVFSGIEPHERIPEGVEQYKVKWTATEVK